MPITNPRMRDYPFLKGMYEDDYYPAFLVDKGRDILVRLCETIELRQPDDEDGLYVFTHAATEEFNRLAEEFDDNESEIETIARELIGDDFAAIAEAYGFDADREELIAPRDW